MIAPKNNPMHESARLQQEFTQLGLDLRQIWQPTPAEPMVEVSQLRDLLEWVQAYRTDPDRIQMLSQGFTSPPILPEIDEESDWLRFELWMDGKPLTWTYGEEFGEMPDPENLSDKQLWATFVSIRTQLATRQVWIDIMGDVPPRLLYHLVRTELADREFWRTAPGTVNRIGCSAYCPGCVQRPWCAMGRVETWPEDAEFDGIAIPEAAIAFVGRDLTKQV